MAIRRGEAGGWGEVGNKARVHGWAGHRIITRNGTLCG